MGSIDSIRDAIGVPDKNSTDKLEWIEWFVVVGVAAGERVGCATCAVRNQSMPKQQAIIDQVYFGIDIKILQ